MKQPRSSQRRPGVRNAADKAHACGEPTVAQVRADMPTRRAPKPKTITLRGADCHRFLRAFDPTFPLHPDEQKANS